MLIGIGSASAFMCSLKVVADRFAPGKRGFLMGATLTLGMVGALTAGKPQVLLADSYGWRNITLGVAALGIVSLLIVFIFVPKKEESDGEELNQSMSSIWKQILEVVKNYRVMLYAFLAVGLYTPFSALADLWGPAFVSKKYLLDKAEAAQTSMMMYIGLGLGSLLLPWLCEKYKLLDRAIQLCGVGILVSFSFILYGHAVEVYTLIFILIMLGLFCGAEMMCFTGAVSSTKPSNSGITIGVVNTMNMLGGAILQQVVGVSLDLQWDGALDSSGVRVYSTEEFIKALSIILIVIALCTLASVGLNHFRKRHGKL